MEATGRWEAIDTQVYSPTGEFVCDCYFEDDSKCGPETAAVRARFIAKACNMLRDKYMGECNGDQK